MDAQSDLKTTQINKPINSGELNSWRRGFTPQAEIWNGRMAMFGLAVCLSSLLIIHLFVGS